eukprot:5250354-Prymnesium_polylepis.1
MAPSPDDELVAAAETVQRCWRRKLARRDGKLRLSLWPALGDLRGLYLDESAIAAGARDSVYYSDEMIVAREALKKHEEVIGAIETAWERLCAAIGVDSRGGQLSFDNYCTMNRK